MKKVSITIYNYNVTGNLSRPSWSLRTKPFFPEEISILPQESGMQAKFSLFFLIDTLRK